MRPATLRNLFRLQGQSIGVFSEPRKLDAVRPMLLDLAREDGYEVTSLVHEKPNKLVGRILIEVEERLRANPGLELWQSEFKLYHMTNACGTGPASLSGSLRLELARVMRLTPYTGIAIAVEGTHPAGWHRGLRAVVGQHERLKYGWGKFRWKSRITRGEGNP